MAAYPPGLVAAVGSAYPPPGPATRIELQISCKDLRRADLLSKSDPVVVVSTHNPALLAPGWEEHARTERINNNQNPQFTKAIELTYWFEYVQKLKFEVYDLDNDTATLADDDFLGVMECTLADIVRAHTCTKPLKCKSQKDEKGTITIAAEEPVETKQMLELQFSGHNLDKKDFLGKSDPYLEFARENPNKSYTPVFKIPHILNTLNPNWPPFKVRSTKLCGNVPSRRLRVQCFDWDAAASPDLIGEFFTSVQEFSEAGREKKLQWTLINPKKQQKKSYKNSGTITLEKYQTTRIYTFLDYIMGGCQINFTVGVDFTGSNGDPSHPSSLHHISPTHPNEYMQALWGVGNVCQEYDTDKLFPAFGFGGKIGGRLSHEFPLNGNWENPYCLGVNGVIQAYQQSLTTVQLYGPTNAAPIINHVANFAEMASMIPNAQNYFVLLMLTDGVLSDMNETKLALIRASRLPMSVIIVGVGKADFSDMIALDADNGRLRLGALVSERDIVQFVPFRQYAHASAAAMAGAVLAEVPSQLMEYMTQRGVMPANMTPQ